MTKDLRGIKRAETSRETANSNDNDPACVFQLAEWKKFNETYVVRRDGWKDGLLSVRRVDEEFRNLIVLISLDLRLHGTFLKQNNNLF